jgi:pyruvate,water dikinase
MVDLDQPWVVDNTPNPRFPLYTRANVAEVAPNVAAPLFVTVVSGWCGETRWRQALANFGVFDLDEFRPDQNDIMPVFYGYLYLNMSVHRVLGVRTPGIDAGAMDLAFFGENPDVPRYEPRPGDDDPKYEARVLQSIQRVLQTTERPDLDEAAELRKNRPELTGMSDEAVLRHARSIIEDPFRRNHEKVYPLVHESSIPVAVLHQLLSGVPDAPAVVELVSGLGDIDSAAPTLALWALSRMVRQSDVLTRHFDAGTSGLLERLQRESDPAATEFVHGFADFLREYGSRGTNEWEIATVTWETEQDIPLAMVERMRQQADDHDPRKNAARLADQREQLTADVRGKLSEQPERRAAFDQALASAVAYMVARERNKTNAVRVLQEARLAYRELGLRMVQRGHFADWKDINMLRDDELDTLLADPDNYGKVAAERLEWAAQLQELQPPYVVYGTVPPPSTWKRKSGATVLPAQTGEQLHGLPACPGTATGRARIITDPSEVGELEVGDVLVAPMTDPGWTPLFASAAAVVVNVGAQLSHAAIVSRELGIPCVVGLPDATLRIPDGATVSVDGRTGVVTVH